MAVHVDDDGIVMPQDGFHRLLSGGIEVCDESTFACASDEPRPFFDQYVMPELISQIQKPLGHLGILPVFRELERNIERHFGLVALLIDVAWKNGVGGNRPQNFPWNVEGHPSLCPDRRWCLVPEGHAFGVLPSERSKEKLKRFVEWVWIFQVNAITAFVNGSARQRRHGSGVVPRKPEVILSADSMEHLWMRCSCIDQSGIASPVIVPAVEQAKAHEDSLPDDPQCRKLSIPGSSLLVIQRMKIASVRGELRMSDGIGEGNRG